ncbi:tubulin epsilon and delta complex protein 1 isoform X2 [Ascaphus truei]|uniref:tubulin epsilon and delta complex protein 1 isoform X2 n=1 Tax=Ascaphus truei TaxID=8439 RepID=UPI003F59C9DE
MRQAGNAQIREALSALCRVLSGGGGSPGPEAFRRAKFNRPEPTAEFWKLLYCLLKQIYQGKDGSPTATNEKETVENQITFVKSVLWNQGYGRSAFYHLPHDGTEGSREALLAFSWLLNRIKLLEKILEINRVKVGDEITACTCPQELFLSRNGNEDAAASSSVKREVDVRYIQWLSGKLRFCWRTLHATQQEKCALLYKIHSYTQGCHVDQHLNHLSVMETDLVRKPENYSELLQLLESENSHLEAYLEWKHLEPVYWQWMIREMERELSEKELCLMVKKIKQEVRQKTEELKLQCSQGRDLHGPFRLVFKESSSLQKGGPSGSVHKDLNTRAVSAPELIKKLQKTGLNMEAELQRLQEECRCRLDDIAEGLEGVICIPPPKR